MAATHRPSQRADRRTRPDRPGGRPLTSLPPPTGVQSPQPRTGLVQQRITARVPVLLGCCAHSRHLLLNQNVFHGAADADGGLTGGAEPEDHLRAGTVAEVDLDEVAELGYLKWLAVQGGCETATGGE